MPAIPLPFQPVIEQPWAVTRATLQRVVDILATGPIPTAALPQQPAPQRRREGIVAVIPVRGAIEHHYSLLGEIFGGTSIDAIRGAFREAMADPDVLGVVLDVDSPGGGVEGVTELAGEIRAARGGKPIVAVANTTAASAAYWLASQADELYVTPSGQVGSIGIFALHEDVSKALENEGVKVTILSAGEHKTDGNPFEPLDDEARATLQKRIDAHYAAFVGDVAAGRGTTPAVVRAGYGEGATLLSKDALAEGMVDGIATLETVIRQVAKRVRASSYRADDAGIEPRAEQDEPDEHLPLRMAVQHYATDGALLVSRLAARAALREKEDRPAFHATVVEQLRSIRASITALIGPDEPAGDPPPEQVDEPPVAGAASAATEVPKAPPPRRFTTPDAWARYVAEGLK